LSSYQPNSECEKIGIHTIRAVLVDWVNYLRREKLWGLDDPLFPATRIATGADLRFAVAGLDRKPVRSGRYSRKRLRRLDCRTSIPTASGRPWRFLGGRICKTPEEYKAWSQNIGHDHVLTTFSSYGDVNSYRQAEIIRAFSERSEQPRQAT
jgi:hypothetical protein